MFHLVYNQLYYEFNNLKGVNVYLNKIIKNNNIKIKRHQFINNKEVQIIFNNSIITISKL
jgi:hypothetical protein